MSVNLHPHSRVCENGVLVLGIGFIVDAEQVIYIKFKMDRKFIYQRAIILSTIQWKLTHFHYCLKT